MQHTFNTIGSTSAFPGRMKGAMNVRTRKRVARRLDIDPTLAPHYCEPMILRCGIRRQLGQSHVGYIQKRLN
jgi:hypothetical protein